VKFVKSGKEPRLTKTEWLKNSDGARQSSGLFQAKALNVGTNRLFNLRILVCLVIHASGKVFLEHLLLSQHPFRKRVVLGRMPL
jgi:hypothetical protein